MAIHSLRAVQKIPVAVSKAWDFFASPANLDAITPGDMSFKTITEFKGEKIYPGQIIEYKVSPILRIPLHWKTEITQVENEKFFIDEQRKGPYSLWRHQHHFVEINGGVEMTDIVFYKNPLGIIGEAANTLFVKDRLRKIFEFRFRKIEELLGKWEGQEMSIEIK